MNVWPENQKAKRSSWKVQYQPYMSPDKLREELTWEGCKNWGTNQWRNTSNVIDWFQNIAVRRNCIFIQFDIKYFYPLITRHHIFKEIEHTKFYTSIIQQQLDIVLQVRKSLSFSRGKLWEKTMNNYSI